MKEYKSYWKNGRKRNITWEAKLARYLEHHTSFGKTFSKPSTKVLMTTNFIKKSRRNTPSTSKDTNLPSWMV